MHGSKTRQSQVGLRAGPLTIGAFQTSGHPNDFLCPRLLTRSGRLSHVHCLVATKCADGDHAASKQLLMRRFQDLHAVSETEICEFPNACLSLGVVALSC